MKIKVLNSPFQLDMKRCYLPVVLETRCPECAKRNKKDLSDEYLSYPVVNANEEIPFYCERCEHEWVEEIYISLNAVKVHD